MRFDLETFETALVELEAAVAVPDQTRQELFQIAQRAIQTVFPTSEFSIWLKSDRDCSVQFCTDANRNPDSGILTDEDLPPGVHRRHNRLFAIVNVSRNSALTAVIENVENGGSDENAALSAVMDCMADYYRRSLLNSLEACVVSADGYAQLFATIASEVAPATRQFHMAAGLRALVKADRVTLLSREQDSFVLLSCSNNHSIDNNSQQGRLLVGAASEVATCDSFCDLTQAVELHACLQQLKTAGVSYVHLVQGEQSLAVLVESYSDPPTVLDLQTLRQQLPRMAVLANQEFGTVGSSVKRFRRLAIGACALLLSSLIIPVAFEIEVRGQAFPVRRVHVFAPSDGVIESLEVENESVVKTDAPLAAIRNDELKLELQRVQGQLSTETARLVSMKRMRSSDARSGESARLSEAATEQVITDLGAQLQLLELENSRMNIRSPCDGIIIRGDLREELLLRPVRRGQSLFEIVQTGSGWHLELDIPDELTGYVRAAHSENEKPLEIDYVFRDHVSVSQSTVLSQLDESVAFNDGQYTCRATANIVPELTSQLRPGASVTARINCGRRSLAFVVMREVIEFGREKSFAWW